MSLIRDSHIGILPDTPKVRKTLFNKDEWDKEVLWDNVYRQELKDDMPLIIQLLQEQQIDDPDKSGTATPSAESQKSLPRNRRTTVVDAIQGKWYGDLDYHDNRIRHAKAVANAKWRDRTSHMRANVNNLHKLQGSRLPRQSSLPTSPVLEATTKRSASALGRYDGAFHPPTTAEEKNVKNLVRPDSDLGYAVHGCLSPDSYESSVHGTGGRDGGSRRPSTTVHQNRRGSASSNDKLGGAKGRHGHGDDVVAQDAAQRLLHAVRVANEEEDMKKKSFHQIHQAHTKAERVQKQRQSEPSASKIGTASYMAPRSAPRTPGPGGRSSSALGMSGSWSKSMGHGGHGQGTWTGSPVLKKGLRVSIGPAAGFAGNSGSRRPSTSAGQQSRQGSQDGAFSDFDLGRLKDKMGMDVDAQSKRVLEAMAQPPSRPVTPAMAKWFESQNQIEHKEEQERVATPTLGDPNARFSGATADDKAAAPGPDNDHDGDHKCDPRAKKHKLTDEEKLAQAQAELEASGISSDHARKLAVLKTYKVQRTSDLFRTVRDPQFKPPDVWDYSEGNHMIAAPNNQVVPLLRHKIELRLPGGAGLARRAFQMFDRDGSGKVDISEFNDVLQDLHIYLPDKQVMELVDMFDIDGSGELDIQVFVKHCLAPDFTLDKKSPSAFLYGFPKPKRRIVQNEFRNPFTAKEVKQLIQSKVMGKVRGSAGILRRTFDYFDKDKSGAIDADELQTVLLAFNVSIPRHEVQAFMDWCVGHRNAEDIDFQTFYSKIMDVDLSKNATATSMAIGTAASNTKMKKQEVIRNHFQQYKSEEGQIALRTLNIIKEKVTQRWGGEGAIDMKTALRCLDRARTGHWDFDQFCHLIKDFNCQAPRDKIYPCFRTLAGSSGRIHIRDFVLMIIAADLHTIKALAGAED